MKISGSAKGFTLAIIVFVGYLSWCCFEQWKDHRWESKVVEAMTTVPGARLVSSFYGGDLANPIFWFWPAKARLVYARPDISTPEPRFYIMSFGNDDQKRQPDVWLTAVDCKARRMREYWPMDSNEGGEPAFNVLGEPITAPDGRVYRLHDTYVQPPADEFKQFCETNWSSERSASRRH